MMKFAAKAKRGGPGSGPIPFRPDALSHPFFANAHGKKGGPNFPASLFSPGKYPAFPLFAPTDIPGHYANGGGHLNPK